LASPVLNSLEVEAVQPFMLRDVLPGSAWAPFRTEAAASAGEMDCMSEPVLEREFHLRGIAFALGLEAIMALAVYGIWQLCVHIR
jgi:hypothetical protein